MNFVIMCCPGRESMVADLRRRLTPGIVLEVWDGAREGALPCALRAFEMGLSAFRGKDFTVMQDDAEVCEGFNHYISSTWLDLSIRGDKRVGVVQWYAHPWVTKYPGNGMAVRELDVRDGKTFLVSLATTYTPEWAHRIAAYLADCADGKVAGFQKDDQGRMHGDDAAIANLLTYYGASYYVHVPSLVQHRGDVSMVAGRSVTLASHDARQSRCYVGRNFDARQLLDLPLNIERTIMDNQEDVKLPPPNTDDVPTKVEGQPPDLERHHRLNVAPVGHMTARQLYNALKELDAEDTADDGQQLGEPQPLPAPRVAHVGNLRDLVAHVESPTTANCNVCGDNTGTCPHVASEVA